MKQPKSKIERLEHLMPGLEIASYAHVRATRTNIPMCALEQLASSWGLVFDDMEEYSMGFKQKLVLGVLYSDLLGCGLDVEAVARETSDLARILYSEVDAVLTTHVVSINFWRSFKVRLNLLYEYLELLWVYEKTLPPMTTAEGGV